MQETSVASLADAFQYNVRQSNKITQFMMTIANM